MQKIKKNSWSAQQIKLLSTLHSQYTSKRWKRIAEEFKQQGFNRTEIECREKWINFIDPDINRKEWEEWQLRKLYEVHAEVGTRWCVVQKFIGRTQNKIKNHFYGTLRNLIRFIVSHFDEGRNCYNNQISHLPPSYLNSLYNATEEFAGFGSEVRDAIYAMTFKIDKFLLLARIEQKRPLYERLNTTILKEFARSRSPKSEQQLDITPPSSQGGNILEPVSFNNIMPPLMMSGCLPHMWGMLPFHNYPPGMMLWYP